MHPEIKRFWIETGHQLVGPTAINSWEIHIKLGEGWLGQLCKIETVCHGNRYRFENEWYSEEEMLKLIKLKAFI